MRPIPSRSGEAEMVVASRLATGAPGSFRPGHRFGNHCFTWLVSVFFGQRMDDIFSGYRAFRRELADRIYFLTGGFEVETEVLVGLLSFSTGFIVHTVNARFLQFEHFLKQRRGH